MWGQRTERLPSGRGLRIAIEQDGSALAYVEALTRLRSDPTFRTFLGRLLADAPYVAFRWETPPVCQPTASRPFEFVLLDSPSLDRTADFTAFKTQFASAPGESVLAFRNLGGDAELIVPGPVAPARAYGHIAAFIRQAPDEQQHALWELVAQVVLKRMGPTPLWLSTAGAGVPWLHVRLDASPKYYGYAPYRAR